MQYVKGPLLILAGAGSGKTSLLTQKIAWLIREYGVDPAAVVAVTANPYTAARIRLGATAALRRKIPALSVSSYNQFNLKIVQQQPDALGLRSGFSLYDAQESEAVVGRLLEETWPRPAASAREVYGYLAQWKRDLDHPPPPAGRPPGNSAREVAAWLRQRYEQRLRTANAIDLADLAAGALKLLGAADGPLVEWRAGVRFLLVDEYEQSSAGEHEIVRLLAARGTTVTAAGDDSSIAGETDGEDIGNLMRLRSDLPNLRVIALEQNFRSNSRILKAADLLLARACPAPAAAAVKRGAPLRALQVRSEQHAAETIVEALVEQKLRNHGGYRNYAILVQRMEQANAIARALQARGVPYHFRGNGSLFAHVEVRDVWAYLKLLCNPADDNAFLRVLNTPRRDIDRATVEQLTRFAVEHEQPLFACALDSGLAQHLAPAQQRALGGIAELVQSLIERAEYVEPARLVSDLLIELNYEEWLRDTCNDFNIAARCMDNVMQLVTMLDRLSRHSPDATLRTVIARMNVSAVLDTEANEPAADAVTLMTLLAARGCEFNHVYLVGLDEVLLPLLPAQVQPERAEQRRLAYIGITRAVETVTFAVAEHRSSPGVPRYPRDGLLSTLPAQDIEWIDIPSTRALAENALAYGSKRWGDGVRPSR